MKGKKGFVQLGIALCALSLLLVPFVGGCGGIAEAKYTLAHPYLEGDNRFETDKYWADEVTRLTEGAITFELYPGGTLVATNEHYDACAQGICDVAYMPSGYYSSKEPFLNAFTIPWGVKNFEHAKKVYAKALPYIDEVMAKHNLKALMPRVTEQYILCSKEPIHTLEDIAGKKYRSPGGFNGQFLTDNGGGAVVMTFSETYMALQTGVVDASPMSLASYHRLKMYEVAPYVTLAYNLAPVLGMTVVNLDVWNSLDKKVQEIMIEATPAAIDYGFEVVTAQEKEMLAECEQFCEEIYDLPEQERERWRETTYQYYDDIVKELPETKPIMDLYLDTSLQ